MWRSAIGRTFYRPAITLRQYKAICHEVQPKPTTPSPLYTVRDGRIVEISTSDIDQLRHVPSQKSDIDQLRHTPNQRSDSEVIFGLTGVIVWGGVVGMVIAKIILS